MGHSPVASILRPFDRRRKAIRAEIDKANAGFSRPSERQPRPFTAEMPFDRTHMLREVDDLVEMVPPETVDTQTGCVLDNIINTWADQWIADLERQHEVFRVTALRDLRLTDGQLAAHRLLL